MGPRVGRGLSVKRYRGGTQRLGVCLTAVERELLQRAADLDNLRRGFLNMSRRGVLGAVHR